MNQPQSLALLYPEIKELLEKKDYPLLKQIIRECHAVDFADVWKRFSDDEKVQIFRLFSAASALKLFEILDVDDQRLLLERSSDESVFPILEGMDSPDLAKVFHKISPRALKKMQSLFKRQDAIAHIDYLMKFPENTAGSLMHPEFVRLSPKLTAKQAVLRLQTVIRPHQKEHLNSLYVVEDDGRVLGTVGLHDLITAPEDMKLGELMDSVEGIKVKPETDQEEVSKLFSKYQLAAAPVVDEGGKLIGVLSVKDILSIERQEATEDIAKMVGTRPTEFKEHSTVFGIFGSRMPWLVVTILGEILASYVIKSYEATLTKVIALASFSPLIAAMGGNVGAQSATVVVRSLALRAHDAKQKAAVVFREFRVGLLLGLVYGTFMGVVAYVLYGNRYSIDFSFVVGAGMCISMTVAATMGSIEPIIFERIGVDPATATGPLITTITDIFTVTCYFTLATLLLLK